MALTARTALLAALLALAPKASARAQATADPVGITFPSKDSLRITANVWVPHPLTAPFIVLFHQAGSSRAEYTEIAPRLVAMGFNCMAVDARAGGSVNGVRNETAQRAKAAGRGTDFLDAEQDLEAAIRYVRARYARGKVLGWGSSYSAALVLRLAGMRPGLLDGVLAFSPGEYFTDPPGSATYVRDGARRIAVPVFITSARSERKDWMGIYGAIDKLFRRAYVPEREGSHGSSALWKSTNGQEGYWQAVRGFLNLNFPRATS
ncbi:MAG TPA: alpha/beta hydrolase [Gemmatimonadales bacterium]|nr:alpha/beta hydrolase [Gemmatimonadales bacterium]